MQFILATTPDSAITSLQARLNLELTAGKKVLWLVSGGSNISASVTIMEAIPPDHQANVTVMLIDERYGEVGHPNSNFEQLMQAGFNEGDARLIPVLRPGMSMEDTSAAYNDEIRKEFGVADIIISQLGIGEDGHISGILPNSPAAEVNDVLVTSYPSEPYQRITTTFRALQAIDVNYSMVFGDSKRVALQRLHDQELSLSEQPAQILKQLPEAYVYNQFTGDPT